jgi:hypothetical protein
MFQVFYLDVAYVAVTINIFCNRMFVNVASILDVCCSKYFMLQDQAREVGADGGGPLGHSGPAKRGSEAGVAAPTCMCRRMRTTAASGARPASTAAATRGQVRQERAYRRAGAACMCCGPQLGKVGGHGAVHASLPLTACIQESASSALFLAACRGSASSVSDASLSLFL